MRTARRRLDQLLVERGLAPAREKAQALILAGEVTVDGQKASKASQMVGEHAVVELAAKPPYVSRGGLKLAHALEHFGIEVNGLVCLDVGASTGGFTDCLLQHGATRVYALDVGHGQMDWKLRNDPRVVVIEECNARYLEPGALPEPAGFATMDVSFISATLILPKLPALLQPRAGLVVLVKPQFEAGRGAVGKGGIVRDPAVQEEACNRVRGCVESLGFQCRLTPSPITGAEGNREFLLYAFHPHDRYHLEA
ncbi:MAG: TlyA family RNA methyltransferase [Bryobacterales bacterium]|nr:TlyA family RNA methyltransferase [Bryobacterales bacterium]